MKVMHLAPGSLLQILYNKFLRWAFQLGLARPTQSSDMFQL